MLLDPFSDVMKASVREGLTATLPQRARLLPPRGELAVSAVSYRQAT